MAGAVIETGYSTMSDWFFQMVFVATTASIFSGAVVERVKMWSFFQLLPIRPVCVASLPGLYPFSIFPHGGGGRTRDGGYCLALGR